MANPILAKKPDSSVQAAVKAAFKDGKFSGQDLSRLLDAALDGKGVSDLEYRDLKRLLRTERRRLSTFDRMWIAAFLVLRYPLSGPFLFPGNVDLLEGAKPLGNHACAALVQKSQPIGQASTWREGIPVRGNGNLVKRGTAVATFEDGFYPNRKSGNHVAYYLSQDRRGIDVMDQWGGKREIASRRMSFKGARADGLFRDPSNNGDALSVIMRRKR